MLDKIEGESQGHVGTGLIGGQWLMRVLLKWPCQVACLAPAAQRTYPGWGYMVEKGATTIWELWNGDAADPSMNSGNHVMLVGDLGIWLFESLAGIKPDPAQPGFKQYLMWPEPVGHLTSVPGNAPVALRPGQQRLEPGYGSFPLAGHGAGNATATLHVPARSADSVRESGLPAARAHGVRFIRMDSGRAVFEVGSGDYAFDASL